MITTVQPLHQQLSRTFRERIERGDWPEGSPLPSESALCREFGTSRGPVRQALASLRAEGLVVGGRGRPPVVGRLVPSQPFSTFLSFTEWAHGTGRTPGQRTLEVSRRPASPAVALALELDEGDAVVDVVRVRLLDGVPTMLERSSFIVEIGRHLFDFDTDSGSIYAFLTSRGADLGRARHTIDAVAANALDVEALGVPLGTPLLRERRLASDAAGRPVEYADDRYRPELANFTIENSAPHRTPLARTIPAPPTPAVATLDPDRSTR